MGGPQPKSPCRNTGAFCVCTLRARTAYDCWSGCRRRELSLRCNQLPVYARRSAKIFFLLYGRRSNCPVMTGHAQPPFAMSWIEILRNGDIGRNVEGICFPGLGLLRLAVPQHATLGSILMRYMTKLAYLTRPWNSDGRVSRMVRSIGTRTRGHASFCDGGNT